MHRITLLGLGAMGSRMAASLLRAGHPVTVWNRTPAAMNALVAAGATAAPNPRAAAAGADFVVSMVRDDYASRAVWRDDVQGAFAGMKPGAVAIESSTLSPAFARSLGDAARVLGIGFLEAPVSGSRPQAEAGQLVHLVGGDLPTFERSAAVLRAMGSAAHLVGPVGSAALAKLAANALLGVQVVALAEVIGLLDRHGVDTAKVLQAVAGTSVWPPVAHYVAGTMMSGDFRPQFPVELIEKDFGYVVAAAGAADRAPTLSAAREVFREGMARGIGKENMTGVVRLFRAG